MGLSALLAGAVGSLALLIRAGQRAPRLLLLLMAIWMLSPFIVLLLAGVLSKRWSLLTRATLYCLMLVVTLGSLTIYGDDALRPRKAQAAFVYVAVPPASCLFVAIALSTAALISARRLRREDAA